MASSVEEFINISRMGLHWNFASPYFKGLCCFPTIKQIQFLAPSCYKTIVHLLCIYLILRWYFSNMISNDPIKERGCMN